MNAALPRGLRRPVLLAGLPTLALALVLVTPAGASARTPWPGHPGRHLVTHVVHRGDTATGLAVRYHAWTDELVALNHLGRRAGLRVGQRIRIPVVDRAARHHHHHRRHHHRHHRHEHSHGQKHHHAHRGRHHHRQHRHAHRHHAHRHPLSARDRRLHAHGWRHFRMTRSEVRRVVAHTARRHGVPPLLALAVAWQESGWQQPLVSSAGAIGVMQLLPSTGRWMSWYAGRRLHLRDTYDNVLGGVQLLRVLRASTRHDGNAIAAYYEGLGAVRSRGWYRETVDYVRSVRAIRHRLRTHGHP